MFSFSKKSSRYAELVDELELDAEDELLELETLELEVELELYSNPS